MERLVSIPLAPAVPAAGDRGRPLLVDGAADRHTDAFRTLAARMDGAPQ